MAASDPERERSESDATATVDGLAHTVHDGHRPVGSATVGDAGSAALATIGRHVVLGRLGAGAMALVLAAYDARLDRTVAIKLLHPRASSLNGRPRLLKEAQSLAQLAHPNVITVYDVGTHGEHVYIAMELVQGGTLKDWLRDGPHPWRDVLDRFVRAGRGLAAAHAVGIVHRDFKPENVLLGTDDRVLVADFGLATAHGRVDELVHESINQTPSLLDRQLTATGMVVGTPAYMAPEQMVGLRSDCKADQFSFCVALYEAMFGERLRVDPDAPRRLLPPERSKLGPARGAPAWLKRVLLRGLALRPADRWPTMDALLAAIAGRSHRRRRLGTLALGGALLATALGWARAEAPDVASCEGASDAAARVWSSAARERVEAAITGTALAHAEDTWRRVEIGLDDYVSRWTALHSATCSATDVVLAERTRACLARRRVALRATIDVLADSDARVVDRAARVVAALPALDECADPELAVAPVPADPELAAEVEAIRDELQSAAALEQAGRYEEGIALARALLERADETDYGPLQAEAALQLGTLLEQSGDAVAAEATLSRAVWLATAAGHDLPAALAMIRLVGAVGYHQARIEEGLAWARHAEAMTERAHLDRRTRVLLRNNTAAVLFRAGDYEGAGALYEANIATLAEPESTAERQELANSLNNLGNVYARRNQHDLSAQTLQRAVDVLGEMLGPEHPMVAITLSNLGNMRYDQGDLVTSRAYLERALTILRASVGDGHPAVASSLGNLGLVYARSGDVDGGRRLLEESTAIKRRRLGDHHPDLAHSLNNLGEVVRDQGDIEAAAKHHAEAAEIWLGVDPEHPYAAYPLANLGVDLVELGRVDEGLARLRRAAAICETKQVDATIIATTRFGLARALWTDPATRAEALELARDAARRYEDIGGRYEQERERIATWLAEHR